jgi:protein-S-isoprenylcysteine O-methyltransferase Ste14
MPVPFALALLVLRVGETPFSWTLILSGAILTAAGELTRLWAVHHIGVISRTRSDRLGPLVASGPFGLVRNPLYVGNILLWSGFALAARLVWMLPVVFLLLALEYHAIVRWEERLLESRHGAAYRAYAARVPRWIPASLRPGPSAGGGFQFSWRETLFSERGTLIAIAVGYALLWLKLRG